VAVVPLAATLDEDEARRPRQKERTSIVPAMTPLNKPLPAE